MGDILSKKWLGRKGFLTAELRKPPDEAVLRLRSKLWYGLTLDP